MPAPREFRPRYANAPGLAQLRQCSPGAAGAWSDLTLEPGIRPAFALEALAKPEGDVIESSRIEASPFTPNKTSVGAACMT